MTEEIINVVPEEKQEALAVIPREEKLQALILNKWDEYFGDAINSLTDSYLSKEKLATLAFHAAKKNSKFFECSNISIINALRDAAQLGIEFNTPSKHAYLVPMGKEMNLWISYQGMIHLATRTGAIVYCKSEIVYEKDEFDYGEGTEGHEFIKHKKSLEFDRGKPIAVWAKAIIPSPHGGTFEKIVVIPIYQIDKIAKKRGGNFWRDHYDEMAKKTAIRYLMKTIDAAPDLARALDIQARHEGFDDLNVDVPKDFVDTDYEGNDDGNSDSLKTLVKKKSGMI